jgi:hypothetical protein
LGELYRTEFFTRDRDARVEIPDQNQDGIPDEFLVIRDVDETFFLGQNFAQAEYKLSDRFTMTFGIHTQFLSLNEDFAIEPRAAFSYELKPGQRISAAYGLHSQQVPFPILFLEESSGSGQGTRTNMGLDFMRSHHYVVAYDRKIGTDWRIKTEAYYQSLFDIPVEQVSSSYSVINEGAGFVFDERNNLVSEGTGRNLGVEFTLEKFFSKNWYMMTTLSVYDSRYQGSDQVERSSAFNNRFVLNLLGGREWAIGSSGRNALTFDTKFTTAGGRPFTPIDLEATIANDGREVLIEDQAFSDRLRNYLRWDLKFGLRINNRSNKVSHQFFLDLQNVTNRENEFVQRYNPVNGQINTVNQIGFFPDVMYRIQF